MAKNKWTVSDTFIGIGALALMIFIPFFLITMLVLILLGFWTLTDGGVRKTSKK